MSCNIQKSKIYLPIALPLLFLTQVISAHAHTLWINVVPEHDRHVVASIAYGDVMPGSEILTPDWWPMYIERYELVSPSGVRGDLVVPSLVTAAKEQLESGIIVQAGGDIGQRKFIVGTSTDKGTYQILAQTPVANVVHYINSSGEEGYVDANLEEVPNGVTVTRSNLGVNLMKAVFTVGAWTEPEPLGLPLEIVPITDLDSAKVGDKVRFKVLMNGNAWIPKEGDAQITAYNMSFGDRWGLVSVLKYGEGEFRIPVSGLWRVDAQFRGPATELERYRSEETSDMIISIESSFVFHVSP